MTKRILILSEAFGAGHTKAAEAIKDGIAFYQPDWNVDIIELATWLRPTISHWVTEIYLKMIRYSPKLWGVLYRRVLNQPIKSNHEFLLRAIYAKTMQLINQKQPDVIITTHPFPTLVISRLKRIGISVPLHVVPTDYGVHGAWISEEVDYYYLSSLEMKRTYTRLGVSEPSIYVTGLPTNPKFWYREDKRIIRKKVTLNDKPTFLIMSGGLGIGVNKEFLDSIIQFRDEIQFLIVTGKNEKLFTQLQADSIYQHFNIHLYSYVNNIHDLMDASDFIITKPGGMTTAEAIAKNIPMIIFHAIQGQEQDNLEFILQKGFGIAVENSKELLDLLEQYLEDPSRVLSNFRINNESHIGQKTVEQLIHNVNDLDRKKIAL